MDTALPSLAPSRPSRWITRARPKIDRIACPWLILRFIDPRAEFFYVPRDEVFPRAEELHAVPYDIDGAPVTHEGERCSFDALLRADDHAMLQATLPVYDALYAWCRALSDQAHAGNARAEPPA